MQCASFANEFTVLYLESCSNAFLIPHLESIAPAFVALVFSVSPHPIPPKTSQGLVADEAVVVATLFVNGTSHGAQAFLVQMRDAAGKLAVGIGAEDMGTEITLL
jgi:hypothetical protein